jgi:hypothetical protein
MNNFGRVARKPFNRTFKMFKPLGLGAPEVLHLTAVGAEFFTRSFDDQWSVTFCAVRLHERPTLFSDRYCNYSTERRWKLALFNWSTVFIFCDTLDMLSIVSQFS